MEARHIRVSVDITGPGVDGPTCEARLGIDGRWERPRCRDFYSWGREAALVTDMLSEAVEPVLSVAYSVRDKWVSLVDENPRWESGLTCTITMDEPSPRHGDYPCLILTQDQVRRAAELRLEIGIVFR